MKTLKVFPLILIPFGVFLFLINRIMGCGWGGDYNFCHKIEPLIMLAFFLSIICWLIMIIFSFYRPEDNLVKYQKLIEKFLFVFFIILAVCIPITLSMF